MEFLLKSTETEVEQWVKLPAKEEMLEKLCKSLALKNSAKTEVLVQRTKNTKELYLLLGGKTCILEELNFLCKIYSSLNPEKKELFFYGGIGKTGGKFTLLYQSRL